MRTKKIQKITICVRSSKEVYEKMRALSKRHNLTLTQVVNELLERGIEHLSEEESAKIAAEAIREKE